MDKQVKFFGTFLDKDTILKISRWAGVAAWVALGVYAFTTMISFIQFLQQFSSGVFYQKGMSIFDFISFFHPYPLQLMPGIMYFFGLKFIQHALLILMEMEESLRRSSRGK